MPNIINQKNGKVVIHATANVNSNIASFAVGGETIAGLQISQITWGANGSIAVKRGTDDILYLPAQSSGGIDFAGEGMTLSIGSTANVIVNFTDAGFVLLELTKMVSGSTQYDYYTN
jgi:hypothetical protein